MACIFCDLPLIFSSVFSLFTVSVVNIWSFISVSSWIHKQKSVKASLAWRHNIPLAQKPGVAALCEPSKKETPLQLLLTLLTGASALHIPGALQALVCWLQNVAEVLCHKVPGGVHILVSHEL